MGLKADGTPWPGCRPCQAHHIWPRHSGKCCLNCHYAATNYQLTEAAPQPPWGPVEPDWWGWQWKGWCYWGKKSCVWVWVCVLWSEAVMLVSFWNSTDRWSRFGLKVVLISLSLSLRGEMGQSEWDNIQSLAAKCRERKSSELFVWLFFSSFFLTFVWHLPSKTNSADSGLCLFSVNKLTAWESLGGSQGKRTRSPVKDS